MRRPSGAAAFFGTIVVGAAGVIYYVHDLQKREKKEMRAGVIRDIKRDRLRQQEHNKAA
ncbi:hypothetical protein H257_01542 [Aphanomyces astaci]|uniref:Uncharacterized protein n=1 Tax=Aphanomyces astaci TaxID=112090 RepID=W4H8J6_APHAT|nr:hypothetical protein H257_01542 [Aphanomyces astaci]ETV88237.1 hypothetical protein H257_01542 [Aphanomyces astaci]|eukprot:XP_009823100.1 hypothetical protein H257_01542 [Aphanomyces astaci]